MLNLNEFKNKLKNNKTVKWYPQSGLEYFWCFPVKGSPEQIWPYLSDTERMNREMGLTPREQKEINGKAVVTTKMLGIPQRWVEEPWNWVADETLSFTRIYEKGLTKLMHGVFHLEKESDFTNVYIYFGWQPRNWFWSLFLKLTEAPVKSKFAAVFSKVDVFLEKNKNVISNQAYKAPAKVLGEGELKRLDEIKQELKSKNLDNEIIEKLCEHVKTADDLDLDAIRVIRLARQWNKNFKDVLTVCLYATRAGMLNISWNVVCPHCKGSRFSAASLGDIPEDSSCDPCGIKFTTGDAETVEIIFKTNSAVRKVPEVLYCAAEPAKKSHIKIQQKLAPGEEMTLNFPKTEGNYRLRADKQILNTYKIEKNTPNESKLVLKNKEQSPVIFVLEEYKYDDSLLRPAQVLSFQQFRDLFAEEHLNSNVKLNLGEHTILFTDIVGSTKFYEKVGDAKAFSDVRLHFQEVFAEVKSHDGVIVKTIGDAVMASFPTLLDAFQASEKIHKRFHANRSDLSIRLRISIHTGAVIAVQLNTGVDYFGSTVNFGAKIQSCAGAGEIAIKKELFESLNKKNPIKYNVVEKIYGHENMGSTVISVVQVNP